MYDITIIGCGMGGLITAYNITTRTDLSVLLLEKGGPINERTESSYEVAEQEVLRGVGGAGGWSDGKIALDPYIGTHGKRLLGLEEQQIRELTQDSLEIIEEFVPFGVTYGEDEDIDISPDIDVKAYEGLHVGTDGIRAFSHNIYEAIVEDCDVRLNSTVTTVAENEGSFEITWVNDGTEQTIETRFLVNATGIEGAAFTESLLEEFGVELSAREADIGIRLETHQAVFRELEDDVYDFKFYHDADDSNIQVRSFCVNHRGEIVTEYHRPLGINGVNGHSRVNYKTTNSNLAVLATVPLDDDFGDPIQFVRETARSLNDDGYPIYQSLGEFLDEDMPETESRSNHNVKPANVKERLPEKVYSAYKQYIERLADAFPLREHGGYVYAPEIKYFQYKMPLTKETRVPETDMYVVGNASGRTSDLMGAAVLALRASNDIIERTA